jgi:hypothetical protein
MTMGREVHASSNRRMKANRGIIRFTTLIISCSSIVLINKGLIHTKNKFGKDVVEE